MDANALPTSTTSAARRGPHPLLLGLVALPATAMAMALAPAPAPVAAQPEPVVRFVEGTVFAERGERLDMILEAVDVEDLAGFQVSVRWNPRVLEYVDVEVLEAFLTASGRTLDYTPPVVGDDEVTLAAYTVPPSGVAVPGATGSGELLRVGFRTLRAGRSAVDLLGVLLVDTVNDPVDADVESGQVVVVGPGGSEGILYMPYGHR